MRLISCGLLASLACYSLGTMGVQLVGSAGQFNQVSPVTYNGGSYSTQGNGLRVQLPQRFATFALQTTAPDWSQYTHVLVTVTNNLATPACGEFAIDSGATGWAWSEFTVRGNTTETIAFPLQTAQSGVGLNSWPAVDGSTAQATIFGTTVPGNIRMIRIWNVQQAGALDFTVSQVQLAGMTARTTSIIDQYGQQTVAFTGQVTSDNQLLAQASADAALSGQLPYSNDAWGGVAGSGLDAGTGKWRTAKQNNKWYIIDPAGNRFFSTGIVCVGTGTNVFTQNRSSLFVPGALPSQSGSFASNWMNGINPNTNQVEAGYNFYTSNLQRKYGSNWTLPALGNIEKRLRTWGFNTVGPSSHALLYDSSQQMPNMPEVAITGNFRTVPCPSGSFPMPDVYDPAWTTAVNATLQPLVVKLNQNPYNIGLFVDNELPWAFHWSQPNYRYDLAFNVLSAPATQPAKVRFYNTLVSKYRTIQKLNANWGTNYASWSAMLNNASFHPSTVSASLATDMQSFLQGYNNLYFSTIRSKLQTLGYRGLYLGSRFYYYSPETLSAASRYCDVLSFNCYSLTPSQWHADLKSLNCPVMVSEFGFSAMDLGRTGGSDTAPVSEADRVAAYQTYVNDAASWPNMVGLHWYKWDDDPVSGRMWDNSNHTLGLVSVTDMPYQQLINAATQSNTQLNTRLTNP